jgi:hypothetical protein
MPLVTSALRCGGWALLKVISEDVEWILKPRWTPRYGMLRPLPTLLGLPLKLRLCLAPGDILQFAPPWISGVSFIQMILRWQVAARSCLQLSGLLHFQVTLNNHCAFLRIHSQADDKC